ncbi:MAG TPA: hypothetical protein DCW60_01455, partial [Sutterella sp.]|nr:hypothetical protein [Sutterella sp.]
PAPVRPVQAEPPVIVPTNVFDVVDSAPEAQPQRVAAPEVQTQVPESFSSGPMNESGPTYTMQDALDMAESFIAINGFSDAQSLITEVLEKGTPADIERAKALLAKVEQLS